MPTKDALPMISASDLDRLNGTLDGRALGPESPDWDAARMGFNLAYDQRPAAVAEAATPADVERVLRFAAASGLRVAAQSTGHGAPSVPALDGAILLRTRGLGGVAVDADAGVVRAGAGATWGEVADAAAAAGLAGLAGTSGTVGVTGYTLGGGAGWLVRPHGLAAWTLRAAEAVTPAGETIRIDGGEHADLLWSLRGSGSAPVVLTALELGLVPLGEVHAGGLWWPLDDAERVLRAWADWLPGLPDTVTSIARLLRFPPLPALPEHLRGKSFTVVEAAVVGSAEDAARLLAPLRALGPATDTVAAMAAPGLAAVHGDPQEPVPGVGQGALLEELPPAAIDRLLGAAGPGTDCRLIDVEVRHLGAAAGRGAGVEAVLDRVDAPFALFGVGAGGDPDLTAATEASLAAVATALAPWRSARVLPSLADGPFDAAATFGPEAAARLQAVDERYDPEQRLVRAARTG